MLTSCGFTLLFGRLYTFFSIRYVFLTSILLFEIGSAICGAAPSSNILILGRAVAGLGTAGIYTGAVLIIQECVPLHRRPLWQGLFGMCFGIASVAGPLLGGFFTGSHLTWRWCFFINLPLGAFTIAVVLLFVHLQPTKKRTNWKTTLMNLDPVGTILFLPSITCLLLALEWGAADYSWNDPLIVSLFIIFAVLFLSFIAWQYHTQTTTASIPSRIIFQRSVLCGALSGFCVGAVMLTTSLYIPLWFQAIKSLSAIESGIRTIPLVLSVVVGSISSGAMVQKLGYYTPFMIVGSILMCVGTGLLTTWHRSIGPDMWVAYQVVLGLGVGLSMQHPSFAVQVVLEKRDVPTGTALLSLFGTLGASLFAAIGQNLFLSKYVAGLREIGGINAERVVAVGATELKNVVPLRLMQRVLGVYNESLTLGPFLAVCIVACLTVPAALGMEWRTVKKDKVIPPAVPAQERTRLDEENGSGSSGWNSVSSSSESLSDASVRPIYGDQESSAATPPPPNPKIVEPENKPASSEYSTSEGQRGGSTSQAPTSHTEESTDTNQVKDTVPARPTTTVPALPDGRKTSKDDTDEKVASKIPERSSAVTRTQSQTWRAMLKRVNPDLKRDLDLPVH